MIDTYIYEIWPLFKYINKRVQLVVPFKVSNTCMSSTYRIKYTVYISY